MKILIYVLKFIAAVIVIGYVPTMLWLLCRCEWSIIDLLRSCSFGAILRLMMIFYCGYITVELYLSRFANRMKRWSIPLALFTFAVVYGVYRMYFPYFPQLLNVGLFLASMPAGMWLWADVKGEMQKNLFSEMDYEQLSAFFFREVEQIAKPYYDLPRRTVEPRSEIDTNFLDGKYCDCGLSVLRCVVGEIEFPGAYIITTSPSGDSLALIIRARKGEPNLPQIYCDGSRNAIMVYDDNRTIALCDIDKSVYGKITDFTALCVYEVELTKRTERLVRSYFVPITYVAPVREVRRLFGRLDGCEV